MKRFYFLVISLFISVISLAQHSDLEIQFINEINLVRTNPIAYIDTLNTFIKARENAYRRSQIDPLKKMCPSCSIDSSGIKNLYNVEQIRIIKNELIPILKKMKPVSRLQVLNGYNDVLTKYASSAVDSTLTIKHIAMYVKIKGFAAENIALTIEPSVREAIIQFLIDSGKENKDRGHRKNILDPTYTHTCVKQLSIYGYNLWIQEFIVK